MKLIERVAPYVLPALERELARLTRASERASAARAALPPGSSRARVTTLNARWSRIAEQRDRIAGLIVEVRQESMAPKAKAT